MESGLSSLLTNVAAHVWIHELLHISWVSKSRQYGNNPSIVDIKVQFERPNGSVASFIAYGAKICKALARYKNDPGSWIIRNADSLSLYAMVRYVQDKLGDIYPHLPLAPLPPSAVQPPSYTADGLFTVYSNGTAYVDGSGEMSSLVWDSQSRCADLDDQDSVNSDPREILTIRDEFTPKSSFPETYMSNYSRWANDIQPDTRLSIAFAWDDQSDNSSYRWAWYTSPSGETFHACHPVSQTKADVDDVSFTNIPINLPFPVGDFFLNFEVAGHTGCVYSGTSGGLGNLSCPDWPASPVNCQWTDPTPQVQQCDSPLHNVVERIICLWS